MEKLEVFTKGTKAWFKDSHEGYVTGSLVSKDQTATKLTLNFKLDKSSQDVVYESTIASLEKNNFEDLPLLKNPPHLEGADDLTNLSYLHEAAVLNSVRIRYANRNIYTYSGLVLIAMNPFANLNIYSKEQMREYAGRPRHELEPHLFAIAEEAYRKMINHKENQSIIVSGESGAGKTASAKFVMRYFATVDGLDNISRRGSAVSKDPTQANSKIEDAVLSTNPIMESFGNAKTTRNDNSSRFGKYIEILFNPKTDGSLGVEITGAKMRTYLLERSRLVFQPKSERNYHIFYQLCSAAPAAEKADLGLSTWDSFHYLRQGDTGVVNGMDDVAEFAELQKAFSTVGVSVSMQWDIFKICAALLHIGNIKVTEDGSGNASIDDNDAALIKTCNLLGINKDEFKKWLIKRQITTRTEKIMKDAKKEEAIVSRDSVAKFIYTLLFDWLVKVVNQKLEKRERPKDTRFIGVLDIYGFEHFEKNSFEQFCINFANEKLQQEFTRHVFKLEQEEYVAESISWSFIDFNDNGPCIELIEGKLGILDLLDEESRLPSGSDSNLVTKLYNRFSAGATQSKFFEKPRFGQSEFIIKHYALDVKYQIEGFIDKNKDTVSEEQLETLSNSAFDFLKQVIVIEEPEVSSPPSARPSPTAPRSSTMSVAGRAPKKPTLGSIFKGSLIKLMETLRETNPHYIRCIKPNQAKVAFEYEAQNVLGQLVACGVLETIKISRAGYPSKQTFQDFVDRYYFLVHSSLWGIKPKDLTAKIVSSCIKGENKYEIGLTKVFFRAGQLAYLEKVRSEKFSAVIILIQKNAKRHFYRQRYLNQRKAAIKIQAVWRGYIARQNYRRLLENKAATVIQRNFRAAMARKKFYKIKKSVVIIQRAWRRYVKRRDYMKNKYEWSALKIQKTWKMYQVRKEYKRQIRLIILVQANYRRKKAMREFKLLKIEAKSVGNLQKLNYNLENKVVELSLKLNENLKEHAEFKERASIVETNYINLKDRYMKLESESKSKTGGAIEELAELKKLLTVINEEKDAALRDLDKNAQMLKKRDDKVQYLTLENTSLKKEVQDLKDHIKSVPKEDPATVAALKKEVASLREQMSRLVAGKYRTDKANEEFLGGNSNGNLSSTAAKAASRYSYALFESAAQVTASVTAQISQQVEAFNKSSDVLNVPQPAAPLFDDDDIESTDRAIRMLGSKDLGIEVVDSLITNLRIPLPSTQTVATRKEIFFPAHLIGYLLSKLLEQNMIGRMRSLSEGVIKATNNLILKFEDDYVSAFWLSNNLELLSVIKSLRDKLPAPTSANQDDEHSASAVLAQIKADLEELLVDIYYGWLKELKKRLVNMVVPAVIENQSLPGYICKQGGGLWGKWASRGTNTEFTIDQLLNFLSKLSKTMRCYYMEDSLSRQALTELLRYTGISAFNHLLMRKNFCTWKRGVQIQYNVSRLEEWCTGHGISEATLHLQQLLQAGKLLTLNKTSPSDIETIFDVCFLLNPSQIKKILGLYYAADFDSPLSSDLLKTVTERATLTERSDIVLLDLDAVPDFMQPNQRPIKAIETFIPTWISLPFIQAVLSASLSAKQ